MRISVLTPAYNSGKYLLRAINSVLNQDYKNWEHIIIDGGSKDGTIEILESHPHLKWISEPDCGQSDAMNKAFILSTGDLIVYLNADDEMNPGLFEKVIYNFSQTPSTDILVGDLRIAIGDNIFIRQPKVTLGEILDNYKTGFPSNPVSYFHRRSLQERIGKFPVADHHTMDYWFILRAYLVGKVGKMDFVCGTFYLDGHNKTSKSKTIKDDLLKVRKEFMIQFIYRPEICTYLLKSGIRKIKRIINA